MANISKRSPFEISKKQCRRDERRLEKSLAIIEKDRRRRTRYLEIDSQQLTSAADPELLASTIGEESWKVMRRSRYSDSDIRAFLTLPKNTLQFHDNLKSRQEIIRNLLLPGPPEKIGSTEQPLPKPSRIERLSRPKGSRSCPREPRSLYELQQISRMENTVNMVFRLPKYQQKAFSETLRTFSHVNPTDL